MGIWLIDGKRYDGKGRKNEEEFNINLIVRDENIGVQLDVEITPIYCMNCNKQLNGFYKHDGSRYGQVGTVMCNHCGTTIYCTDHDNIVESLNTFITKEATNDSEVVIDYYSLYSLEKDIWKFLKNRVDYDIYQIHRNQTVTLQEIIKEICEKYYIELRYIMNNEIETNEKFNCLPNVVNRWKKLIAYIEKTNLKCL